MGLKTGTNDFITDLLFCYAKQEEQSKFTDMTVTTTKPNESEFDDIDREYSENVAFVVKRNARAERRRRTRNKKAARSKLFYYSPDNEIKQRKIKQFFVKENNYINKTFIGDVTLPEESDKLQMEEIVSDVSKERITFLDTLSEEEMAIVNAAASVLQIPVWVLLNEADYYEIRRK